MAHGPWLTSVQVNLPVELNDEIEARRATYLVCGGMRPIQRVAYLRGLLAAAVAHATPAQIRRAIEACSVQLGRPAARRPVPARKVARRAARR